MIRKSYTVAQKLKIIQAVEKHGSITATAKYHNINKSMLSRWIKQENAFKTAKKSVRKIGSGRTPTFPAQEEIVNEYILQQRSRNYIVSYNAIKSKMSSLTPSYFKASNGWLYSFLKRYKLSLRICTTTVKRATTLSTSITNRADSFHSFVLDSVKDWKGKEFDIWNMDETPVWLDMPAKKTVDVRGRKRIPQLSTGNHRKRLTVVLACSTGSKVKPMIIASPSIASKSACDLNGIHCQANGYMDSTLMLTWIKEYLLPSLISDRNLLIFDSFKGHLTEDVKNCLKENNIRYAVIPGGCTSFLQPLDLTVNIIKTNPKSEWISM